jgi:hypothetical protein
LKYVFISKIGNVIDVFLSPLRGFIIIHLTFPELQSELCSSFARGFPTLIATAIKLLLYSAYGSESSYEFEELFLNSLECEALASLLCSARLWRAVFV